MKAIILAGGEGTRLKAVTGERPKPLVPLLGRPLMDYILLLLKAHGFTEVCAAVRYRAQDFIDRYGDGKAFGLSLCFRQETESWGTAGAVRRCADFIGGEDVLIISGDAACDLDLGALLRQHRESGATASLALCRRSEPLRYGLAVTDGEGWIRAFIEKPDWPHVVTDLVNTGIYVLSPRAVAAIPADRAADFARDLFPALLRQGERLLGVRLQGYWTDIGTPLSYYQCCVDALEGRLALECDPAFRASPTDAAADAPGEGVCFDVPCPNRAEVMGVLSEQLQDLSPDYADGLCLRGINYALRIAPLAATAALRVSVSSPDTEFARALALSAGEMITALGR